MRVRICEDTPEIALFISQALQLNGYDTITATREFTRLLTPGHWHDIDIAIVDLMLPDISGRDILIYLRDNHPGIYRVAITASTPAAEEVIGLSHDTLVKPFSHDELLRTLRKADG